MNWLDAAAQLREQRRPGVLVTLVEVRGHAPREAGAKMIVGVDQVWGSIGGGNLEATAVAAAREMIATGATTPRTLDQDLSDHAETTYGRQCCGGTTTVLLDPLPVVGSVAIFGVGHVGQEIARILARHELDLHLIDAREEYATPAAIPELANGSATVHWHHTPWPEPLLRELPPGTLVLVMTHDHGEDAAIVDAALRCSHLPFVGLIGSSAKWRRIERVLREWGHDEATTARVTTPIGDPRITGKDPATLALSVCVDLIQRLAGGDLRDPLTTAAAGSARSAGSAGSAGSARGEARP